MRSRLILSTLGVTALVLLSTAGTRTVQAANRDVDVDCFANEGDHDWFVATGDTITFTLTNCDQFQIADFDGAILDSGTIVAPIVVNAGEVATFTDTGTSTQHAASVTALSPEHVPAGVLNVTSSVTIPAVAPELDLSSDNLGNGDHYVGDSDSSCAVTAGMHVYGALAVTIDQAGTFTFRAVESDPVSRAVDPLAAFAPVLDPMLALYSTFDPANPDNGVVGCNDDLTSQFDYPNTDYSVAEGLSGGRIMAGIFPYFMADLQPGTYTLVLLTYGNASAAEWVAGDSGGGMFTPGAESVTFEMWGPQGSVSVCTTACTPIIIPDVLPPTGADSASALFAAAAVMFGGALVIGARRRRISAR